MSVHAQHFPGRVYIYALNLLVTSHSLPNSMFLILDHP